MINPATRAPQIGTTATGSSTTPNPPSVTPSMGPQEYLAVTFCGSAGEQADDGSYCTGFPSGYALANLEKTCGIAGTNLGGMIACAAANLQQGTAIDPGTFTVSENNTWRSQTIIIHPLALNTAETGSGILTLNGSGATPHTPVTYQKAGKATLGIAAADVAKVKSGFATAVFSGTASDNILWPETGAATRVQTGTAGDTIGWTESGAGVFREALRAALSSKTPRPAQGLARGLERPQTRSCGRRQVLAHAGMSAQGLLRSRVVRPRSAAASPVSLA